MHCDGITYRAGADFAILSLVFVGEAAMSLKPTRRPMPKMDFAASLAYLTVLAMRWERATLAWDC